MWRPLISGPPTLIKSPLHPQPYCSSSVLPLSSRGRLAAIVPRLPGPCWARILLAKSEKEQAALSDSHDQHICSSPLVRAERPTALSLLRPASSRLESNRRPEGHSSERLLRQLAKARTPSAQTVPRDCSFEAHHGKPAPTEKVGSRPRYGPPQRQGESYH